MAKSNAGGWVSTGVRYVIKLTTAFSERKTYEGVKSMNCNALLQERNRLLDLYTGARGEDRTRILAKLVVIDEELEGKQNDKASM